MGFQGSYAKLIKDNKNRLVLFEELQKLNREEISAGIHKTEGSQVVDEKGTKLIDIAVQNNYGNEWTMSETVRFKKNDKWFAIKKGTHIKIPATRFITRILENRSEKEYLITAINSYIAIQLSKANRFGEIRVSDTVRQIGQFMCERIRSYIDDKAFEPNAPMTVEAKGVDQRLKDKGLLYNSIKYKSKKSKV